MNLVEIKSPNHLVGIIQSLATGSFERKFANAQLADVANAFGFVTQDLTPEQINLGLTTLLEMGYCPDAVLFRRWCLGKKEFDNTDSIADSYIGKHGALSQIIKWIDNPKTPITVAQKQAYDETYHLWANLHSSSDNIRAELAFKDVYEHIVKGLVADRVPCSPYVVPQALPTPTQTHQAPADSDFVKANFEKLRKMMAINVTRAVA